MNLEGRLEIDALFIITQSKIYKIHPNKLHYLIKLFTVKISKEMFDF